MIIHNPFQISNIAPDLNRIQTKAINVAYQAETTGYVAMYAEPGWSGNANMLIAKDIEFKVNSTMFVTGGGYYDSESERGGGNCIVKKGDYFKVNGVGVKWVNFIPCVGA